MTGVISAVIRFREWPALCGEPCVRVRVRLRLRVRVCTRAGGVAWLTPYQSQDIQYASGQLRWKIELSHACVIGQVRLRRPTDECAEKSGGSSGGERSPRVGERKETTLKAPCSV